MLKLLMELSDILSTFKIVFEVNVHIYLILYWYTKYICGFSMFGGYPLRKIKN